MKAITILRNALGFAALLPLFGWAAETTTFDTCIDATGRALPAEADYGQTVLVQTANVGGLPAIRYNPAVLPRLSKTARLFFYAHQCARPATGSAPAAQARLADCVGLSTLLASGLITQEDVPALQAELNFSAEEWDLLPGPRRSIDLTGCHFGNIVRLPPATMPTERQNAWNACVRTCADRLWQCQKRGGNAALDGCVEAHQQCKAACSEQPNGD